MSSWDRESTYPQVAKKADQYTNLIILIYDYDYQSAELVDYD